MECVFDFVRFYILFYVCFVIIYNEKMKCLHFDRHPLTSRPVTSTALINLLTRDTAAHIDVFIHDVTCTH